MGYRMSVTLQTAAEAAAAAGVEAATVHLLFSSMNSW